jgi:hypothetical protein
MPIPVKNIRLKSLPQLFFLAFLLFSLACSKKDPIPHEKVNSILINEGDDPKVLQIDGESLSISLLSAQPLFSEGVFLDDGFIAITVYDAMIKINEQTMNFRTTSERDGKNKKIEKDWDRLQKTYHGIEPLGEYQVGISDLYPNPEVPDKYIVKILIK